MKETRLKIFYRNKLEAYPIRYVHRIFWRKHTTRKTNDSYIFVGIFKARRSNK